MNVNVADITIALLLDQNSIYTKSRSEMCFTIGTFTYQDSLTHRPSNWKEMWTHSGKSTSKRPPQSQIKNSSTPHNPSWIVAYPCQLADNSTKHSANFLI